MCRLSCSVGCTVRLLPTLPARTGEVKKLVSMKNAERLQLFQEIAGTRVYDERRLESKKIMVCIEGDGAPPALCAT